MLRRIHRAAGLSGAVAALLTALVAFAAAMTTATAAPAATPDGGVPGISAAEIKVGMVAALSGPASALGKGMLEGANAVFKEANANGGVHGRKINLLVADDGYEPDNTVTAMLDMVLDRKVFALFGSVGTPTTNAVLPIVSQHAVPLVGVLSGAASLREPVIPEVFNVRAGYDDEGEALVEHLLAAGVRSVGVVYQLDGFGLAVLSSTEKALKKRGLKVVSTGTFQRNTVAVRSALALMIEAQPDAVVMVGTYAPVAAFIKLARSSGLKSKLAMVSFVSTDDLVPLVGAAGDGVLISQVVPFPGDSNNAAVRDCEKTVTRYAQSALGYINFEGCLAARVFVYALQMAGPNPTRQGFTDALNNIRNLDLGGTRLSFTPDRHQASQAVYLTQIRDGKIADLR